MNIAILGTGNMGRALIAGLRRKYGGDTHLAAWDKNGDALKGIDPAVDVSDPQEWFAADDAPDVGRSRTARANAVDFHRRGKEHRHAAKTSVLRVPHLPGHAQYTGAYR
jgi:hypothetical protein